MQEALPYRAKFPIYPHNKISSESTRKNISYCVRGEKVDDPKDVVRENAVTVLARRGCCMSHVVRTLLRGLGVNPAIYEVDERDEIDVAIELEKKTLGGGGGGDGREGIQFPAVFIGGEYFGGLDRIMATHITGELTPILKQAGALWL